MNTRFEKNTETTSTGVPQPDTEKKPHGIKINGILTGNKIFLRVYKAQWSSVERAARMRISGEQHKNIFSLVGNLKRVQTNGVRPVPSCPVF